MKRPVSIIAFLALLPLTAVRADAGNDDPVGAISTAVEANAHCRQRVESALGPALAKFVPLRQQHEKAMNAGAATSKRWLETGGEADLKQWLAANAGHPAEPMARFCLARSLAKAGDGDAGRKLLRQILEEDGLRCTLLDDAQFWIGISHNWEKDFDKAKTSFGVLLRDFPASHSAKQVAGKFPPAGPVKLMDKKD